MPALTGRTRATLGAAALYHTSYSALTDYEGGVTPQISMRQHLALDALGAASLCGAALLTARRNRVEGGLLLAVGLAELAVIATSDSLAANAPPCMTYPPLDVLKPVAGDLWTVDSVIGPNAPVRMTVIRLSNGDLLLHSPTRLTAALRQDLERLGRIRHLVAPNIAHWTFIKPWQDAVPDTLTWAAPGLRARAQVRRSGLRIDHDLADAAPSAWAGELDQVIFRGGAGFHEVAMLHRPSRTALLTDMIVNLEPGKLPWLLRPAAWALGILAPAGHPPAYLRAIVNLQRRRAATAAAAVLAWDPARVMLTHGQPIDHDVPQRLRRSLAWLVG